VLQSASVNLPQCRFCDEQFKREQGQKNQARADVHSAGDNYQHFRAVSSLRLRFTAEFET
jgi:hypothetical protein